MLLIALAWAGPTRTPHPKPHLVVQAEGLRDDLVHVRLVPGARMPPVEGRVVALGDAWFRVLVPSGSAAGVANALNADPRVEVAVLAASPTRPPADIEPTTPDFTDQQSYLEPAPVGLGRGQGWPGVGGEHVTVADIEYGFDPTHEELTHTADAHSWGYAADSWTFHGNMVLSLLVGQDDGYGVTGFVPDAQARIISPYVAEGDYDVAAAIQGAAALLEPGDVLLIEQQVTANGSYAPVEVSPAVFDAIRDAVDAGIVVVEPAGNGGQDLDGATWEGWFDREARDSGAILVGGGAGPEASGETPRGWNGVSCYGSRVDVQGVASYTVVAATTGDYEPDLFFPDGDDRQAYTTQFGGTSGASAMVAGVAAAFQSVAIELTGQPWAPQDLRALMVATGTPQAEGPQHIGPQPDLDAMLRAAGLR